jgi:hypothetical protein
MKIRFKVHHRPKGDAGDIPSYKAGETYTFDGPVSEGYAQKYIRLGLAVEAVDAPAPVVAPVFEDVVEVVDAFGREDDVKVVVPSMTTPRQTFHLKGKRK